MIVPVKLLIDEKNRLDAILEYPYNVLEEFSNYEMVSWSSFESKVSELKKNLQDVIQALELIDPEKEFHE